jgi:glycerophosphoryl diester phosphodiesterase
LSSNILVIGHRGLPTRFPDNSLPGFLAAAQICDAVELDVRRSSDGKLVLAHDPRIGDLEVNSNPWSILSEIDLGGGVKPCLLDEALAALPDTPVIIEIKNSPADPGYELDSRLALEAASRTRPFDAVISFNWASIESVKRHFPDVATGLSVGMLGDLDEAIQRCLDGDHQYLVPDIDLFDRFDGELATEVKVLVWTSQRFRSIATELDDLVSHGVSGIITDDPEATRDLIRSQE